jgi:hypothetical protein
VGNVYVLDSSILNLEAFRLYCLGPDYYGGLTVKMETARIYDVINDRMIGRLGDWIRLGLDGLWLIVCFF